MPNSEFKVHHPIVIDKKNFALLHTISRKPNLEYDPDLNHFRTEVDHHPYFISKKNVLKYRVIFFLLGAIFTALALFVFVEKTSWFCSILFTNCWFAQMSLFSLCMLLAISSTSLGIFIRPEQDAVHHLAQRAKKKILRIYAQKCPHFGYGWLLIFRGDKQAASLLKTYHDAVDKLNDLKHSTIALLKQVANSENLDFKNKEHLFNQALLELKDKLNWIVRSFNS